MSLNRAFGFGLVCFLLLGSGLFASAALASEVPMFMDKVKAGELPPIEQRLPAEPLVVDFAAEEKTPGNYGGDLNLLMGKAKDIGQLTVYTYGRLVGYGRDYKLYADIAASFEVSEGREFTFRLRDGHKWSERWWFA